ncbi:MAG: fasciclin domain-containing protein [Hyphomicrobium sp.]|nr:fasciclin domain-containing protein [Hyphomicrobium sp.]
MRLGARAASTFFSIAILSVALMWFVPAPALSDEPASAEPNLKRMAVAAGVLGRMMEATRLAGLDNPEVDVGPLTLLAPTDAAFDALPADIKTRLLAPENRGHLTDLLLFHALPGLYTTERLLTAPTRSYIVSAIDGSELVVNKSRETRDIEIEGARIVSSDLVASDGIIHVIDKVLVPPHVMEALTAPPSTEVAAEGDQ